MAGFAISTSPARSPRRALSAFPEMMELQRVFEQLPFFQGQQATTPWQPPVDIFEGPDEIVIKMELPEIKKDDVAVNLDGRTLSIAGERRLEREDQRDGYHRIERAYGQFSRSFTIPENVNREGLRAEYTDGVLRVRLPKLEEAKPRQISIE